MFRQAYRTGILGYLLAGVLLFIAFSAVRAEIFNFGVFLKYLFAREVLIGAFNAFMTGTLALLVGVSLGLIIAVARLSNDPILVGLSSCYVHLLRGIPMLIHVLFWFNAVPILIPQIALSIPFTSITLIDAETVKIITPGIATVFGLGVAESAYMAEIYKGGFLAIDKGQLEASYSLGLPRRYILLKVMLPQVLRIIIPNTGNEYISLLKSTSLAMTIGYVEVLRVVTNVYSASFEVVELLSVAVFWYFVLTTLASILLHVVEKKYIPHC